jgi:hypothetical protein
MALKLALFLGIKKIAGGRRINNGRFHIPKCTPTLKLYVGTSGFVEFLIQNHFSASNCAYFKPKTSKFTSEKIKENGKVSKNKIFPYSLV